MNAFGQGSSLWTGPRSDHRRYRVDVEDDGPRSLGDGGEGLVYRATATVDGDEHEFALKMLTTIALDEYESVELRARPLTEIDCPHLMRQVETFVGTALVDIEAASDGDFDVIYSVARWVPGVALDEAVATSGPVAGLGWVGQTARGVACLHAFRNADAPMGVVHRDIKPSNVRVDAENQAVLIDFGIARPHHATDYTGGAGTFLWRAPEAVGGPGTPGPASDAWGVGALAYWVLLGEPPRLDGAAAARERLAQAARNASFSDPVGLSRHISRLLEANPADRPADLEGWADELDEFVAGRRRRRRLRRVAAASLAGLCALAAIVALVLSAISGSETPADASTGARYQLPAVRFTNGVVATETWSVPIAHHDRIHAAVTVENTGGSALVHAYDEVIPKALAPTIDAVKFATRPDSIVKRDPIVRYCLHLDAHTRVTLDYDVSVKPTRSSSKQLSSWAGDWQRATNEHLANPSGAACAGADPTPPAATIDATDAGTLNPTDDTTAPSGTRTSSAPNNGLAAGASNQQAAASVGAAPSLGTQAPSAPGPPPIAPVVPTTTTTLAPPPAIPAPRRPTATMTSLGVGSANGWGPPPCPSAGFFNHPSQICDALFSYSVGASDVEIASIEWWTSTPQNPLGLSGYGCTGSPCMLNGANMSPGYRGLPSTGSFSDTFDAGYFDQSSGQSVCISVVLRYADGLSTTSSQRCMSWP